MERLFQFARSRAQFFEILYQYRYEYTSVGAILHSICYQGGLQLWLNPVIMLVEYRCIWHKIYAGCMHVQNQDANSVQN